MRRERTFRMPATRCRATTEEKSCQTHSRKSPGPPRPPWAPCSRQCHASNLILMPRVSFPLTAWTRSPGAFRRPLEMVRLPCAPSSGPRRKQGRQSLQPKRVLEKLPPAPLTSTLCWGHDRGPRPFPPDSLRGTTVVPAGGRWFLRHAPPKRPFRSFKYTSK